MAKKHSKSLKSRALQVLSNLKQYRNVALAAVVAAVVSGSGGYFGGDYLTQVTEEKYTACMQDQFVQVVGQAEMYMALGGDPSKALANVQDALQSGKVTKEEAQVYIDAMVFATSDKIKISPTIAAFAQCLNK